MVSAGFVRMNGVGWALSWWMQADRGLEARADLKTPPADDPSGQCVVYKGQSRAAVVFTTAQSNITS
jgi:hypothetical protein